MLHEMILLQRCKIIGLKHFRQSADGLPLIYTPNHNIVAFRDIHFTMMPRVSRQIVFELSDQSQTFGNHHCQMLCLV